jgi:23S rRNA (cytosine1962-C5)-methyltransferase
VLHEDEHLLVVDKPAGLNTHAPDPFAGEGLYDWLRHREPRWASLAIIHRLDKETSGVMVFGKTALANRSLTAQFTQRGVRKKYLLLTDRPLPRKALVVRSRILRAGERYVSAARGEPAETRFKGVGRECDRFVVEAEPMTGRTHQIRVHAADRGFPILGDTLYGGAPAARVFLRADSLTFQHPATSETVTFTAQSDFSGDARLRLRNAVIEPEQTNICRLIHGASDGWPGWYVDRIGDFLLSQSERDLTDSQCRRLEELTAARSTYHKRLERRIQRVASVQASPRLVLGAAAPERFVVRENGVRYELSLAEGYSAGLFLDQRDNRRRLLTGHIAAGFSLPVASTSRDRLPIDRTVDRPRTGREVSAQSAIGNPQSTILNVFAYTCGFSVCAALAGARTTSLDLSKKYLEWGRRNFALNGLDSGGHDFIYGDAFDWLRRLAKQGRIFDAVLLDPPTFSQSKSHSVFRAEKDYGALVSAALPLLKPGGVLFASTNAAGLGPEVFLEQVEIVLRSARREILQRHYVPQPPDFPISRAEPAYLKTIWLRLT